MDGRAEQLKAVGQLATMMAFFAVSAFCEIRIPQETESIVILLFGLLSAAVVSYSVRYYLIDLYNRCTRTPLDQLVHDSNT